uniref:NADPH-dependent glutamate synthase beta chain and related oxidoreductases n=1 Tax=uncultured Chloroflexi bacterium HF0200_06I16 TaxID=710735 RepID=E0XTY1_9CHLR|nr:NADPH-dependent glutamate synthase beta chain and related oxidoreductases [uncultured Chloroflexi bacterium HF0200_06I16]
MGKPTGFIESDRQPPEKRSPTDRKGDYNEFYQPWDEEQAREQGSRCMDCAVPFCHMGCPLGNVIPEFNHQIYKGDWEGALVTLLSTNNFPEFTGRICPAPCEASCVLSINSDPVTIEYIEKEIVERGYENNWIKPQLPVKRTGKKVVVVGSGPSGLAAAQQLNRAGHLVTVMERSAYIGGLLSLGIPEFKLEKNVVQRRIDLMTAEGITFLTDTNVGVNFPVDQLLSEFDAVCLACGSTQARELDVPGRDLEGVHLAMEYLSQQNRVLSGEDIPSKERIEAEGKRVVILGGGDTGADCLGTAIRQGAEVVHQIELLGEPPEERTANNPWPEWPQVSRSSPAHDEGGTRDYSILTKAFSGKDGKLEKLHAVKVEWKQGEGGRPSMEEIAGSEFEIETELTLLAMGFIHPEHDGMLSQIGVDLDARGNIALDNNRMSSVSGVFAAGDAARGQSLVVWAISEGRETARSIDLYLMGETSLPHSLPENG